METARIFVGTLTEFTTGVETCENKFYGGNAKFWVNINRDAATIIRDRNRAINVNRYLDPLTIASKVLVDRVVENLKNAVVQAAFIGVADIHAGPFPNGLQTLQFIDLCSAVFLAGINAGRCIFRGSKWI